MDGGGATDTRSAVLEGWTWFLGGMTLIYGVSLAIVHSSLLEAHPMALGIGVAADLTVLAAALFWGTLVRTGRVSSLYMTPFLVASAAIAWALLGETVGGLDTILIGLVAAVELVAAGLLLFNLGRAVTSHRAARERGASFEEALTEAVGSVFDNAFVTELFVTEVSMLYYGLVGWTKADEPADEEVGTFSYHRACRWRDVTLGLSLLLIVEIVPVHLFVAGWSPAAAWVVTALSLYSLLWMVGDYHAMRLTPIRVGDRHIEVRIGRRWRTQIELESVVRVESVAGEGVDGESVLDLSLLGGPDVVIEVECDQTARGLFGIERPFRRLALSIDRPDDFVTTVERARNWDDTAARTDG